MITYSDVLRGSLIAYRAVEKSIGDLDIKTNPKNAPWIDHRTLMGWFNQSNEEFVSEFFSLTDSLPRMEEQRQEDIILKARENLAFIKLKFDEKYQSLVGVHQ